MKFDEAVFPWTEDQIQDLFFDLLYECGFDPTDRTKTIPDFQTWLNNHGFDLKGL